MRNWEFFATRLEQEIPGFVKVLRALPEEKLDYRPHEKNTSAGQLAWQMAKEIEALSQAFDKGEVAMTDYPPYPSVEEIADTFERSARAIVERVRTVDEKLWKGQGKFSWNGATVWEAPVADLFWGFLFDLVHHRGQLTAYLRPMGGKVPGVYGPSADDRP